MQNWHEEHLNVLSTAIVNEFSFLYDKVSNRNDSIYAIALVLDSDILTAYLAISTKHSLNDKHKDCKWEPSEWLYTINDGEVVYGLNLFVKLMIKHYDDDITPLYREGFNYEIEKEKNLYLYMEALKEAKLVLINKFGNSIENIIFYLTVPGEPKVEIESAKKINKKIELLDELINYRAY